jgi:hypothetical protein
MRDLLYDLLFFFLMIIALTILSICANCSADNQAISVFEDKENDSIYLMCDCKDLPNMVSYNITTKVIEDTYTLRCTVVPRFTTFRPGPGKEFHIRAL